MPKSIRQSIDVRNTVSAPKLSTTAKPVDTFVQPEKPRELQTAEALKSLGQGLGGLAQNYRQSKEESDIAGLDAEIALAQEAVDNGSIKNIREYKEWPQYSAAVQLKLNSRLGQKDGQEAAQKLQSFFSENPKHLTDDDLRAQAILDHRPEVSEDASKAYSGMMVSSYNNATNALTNAGMNMRAQEVKEELREADGAAVDSVILNPNGFDPAALDALDAELQESSLLSKPQLKALYAERIIAAADTNNDPELLDHLDQKKYGSAVINNKIANAKRSITNRLNSEASAARTKREQARTDHYRTKSQDIVRAAADGTLDPQDYRDEPDARLFELATKYTTAVIIPPVQSTRNVATLKQSIENYVRSDGAAGVEGLGSTVDKDEILDLIQNDKTINASDKIRLMNSIDSVMSVDALQSSRVYSEGLSDANSSITAANKSIWADIAQFEGVDIQGELKGLWKDTVSDLYQEYVEANDGNEPPRSVIEGFVDTADRAMEKRVKAMERRFLGEDNTREPTASNTQTNGAPEIGTVQNGFRFKGGDPAQSSSWEPSEEMADSSDTDGGAA